MVPSDKMESPYMDTLCTHAVTLTEEVTFTVTVLVS